MKSRVRFGLTVTAIVLLLLGFAAIAASILGIFSGISDIGTTDEFGDFQTPGRLGVVLSTLLPVGGAVCIVLAIACVLGAVASLVATEVVDRIADQRQRALAETAETLSASETLEN